MVKHVVVAAPLSSGTSVDARMIVGNDVFGSFFFVPTQGNASAGIVAFGDQSVLFDVDGGNSIQTLLGTDGAFATINNQPIASVTFTGYLLDCTVNTCAPIAP